MYNKIIVTGGTGLVGSALNSIRSEYPERQFVFLSSKDCNLTMLNDFVDLTNSIKPDAIIHLAAVCGGVAFSIKYPAKMLRDNVLMNINVMEAARICRVKKVVMSLSTGMYPEEVPNPILEEYIHNGCPHSSNYSYAFAKRLVDPMIKSYRAEYGINAIGLVPNGIFGENCNFRYEEATMLPALIRRFYENKGGKENIVIWGDGTPLREYTYSKDMARAYMWCLDNYDDEQILHVGTIEELSVKEIALLIAEMMGVDKKRIVFDTSKPNGQFKKSTDNSKFIRISDFKYTLFKEGLNNTVKWFCENYDNPSKIRL